MSGSGIDWEAYDRESLERHKNLVEKRGYASWDATSIINRQENELNRRIEAGQPTEPFLRSIAVDPTTTRVLSEAQLQALEQQKVAAESQQSTTAGVAPEADLKPEYAGSTPAQDGAKVDDLEAFLAASQEATRHRGR